MKQKPKSLFSRHETKSEVETEGDQGHVVVGFAIFHIILFQKKGKKKRKKALLHGM
jgi:hypothetical protein